MQPDKAVSIIEEIMVSPFNHSDHFLARILYLGLYIYIYLNVIKLERTHIYIDLI